MRYIYICSKIFYVENKLNFNLINELKRHKDQFSISDRRFKEDLYLNYLIKKQILLINMEVTYI